MVLTLLSFGFSEAFSRRRWVDTDTEGWSERGGLGHQCPWGWTGVCVHIYVPDATGEMRSLGEEWVRGT